MHRLNLPAPPRRIEAFDLSTHQVDTPVGAMVVLEERTWCKADYRRFRIQSASGRDDYAMMYEVLRRRLTREELPRLIDSARRCRGTCEKGPDCLAFLVGWGGTLSAAD